jgi:hypothetical protein
MIRRILGWLGLAERPAVSREADRAIAAILMLDAYRTYGNAAMLGFIPTTITVNPKLGRVYTAEEAPFGGKAWYAKSGKNCYSPTGQARLVVPTPQLVECIEKTKREENERQRERMREYFPKMMEDE